jgi:hypothetical protein
MHSAAKRSHKRKKDSNGSAYRFRGGQIVHSRDVTVFQDGRHSIVRKQRHELSLPALRTETSAVSITTSDATEDPGEPIESMDWVDIEEETTEYPGQLKKPRRHCYKSQSQGDQSTDQCDVVRTCLDLQYIVLMDLG